jgi:hypothetical protein
MIPIPIAARNGEKCASLIACATVELAQMSPSETKSRIAEYKKHSQSAKRTTM